MKKKLIAGAAGVVLASSVALVAALPAHAETLTPTAESSSASETGGTTSEHRAGHRHRGKGFDAAALATTLGLTETVVADAVSAVRESAEPGTRPSSDATEEERAAAKDARRSAFATALATELKIDEATVESALTDLRAEKEANREERQSRH